MSGESGNEKIYKTACNFCRNILEAAMEDISKKSPVFLCLFIIFISICLFNTRVCAYDFDKFNFVPPFIAAGESPSVVFLCDTSGSMDHLAYAKRYTTQQYDADTVYYGYFDPYAYYRYVKCKDNDASYARSGFFEENAGGWTDSKGDFHGNYAGNQDGVDNVDPLGIEKGVGNFEWSGNFLNYISMRRMDILKRVLMGGRRAPDDFGDIFDDAPGGYDTGGNVNPLDFLVVGDYLYYGDRQHAGYQDQQC